MNRPERACRRLAAALLVLAAAAGPAASDDGANPTPTLSDAAYGPDPRHRFDLWKADGPGPTPVVVHFHGGAFRTGDKRDLHPLLLRAFLRRGISVVSANYRLSGTAAYPAPMRDGARVVQFLRGKAAELGLDPGAVGAFGRSAGGGIALWLAYHDDLADPAAADPVLRRSSRLAAAGGLDAQTSYDPAVIARILSLETARTAGLSEFFGLPPRARDDDRARRLHRDASPATHLTADDPPVLLLYFGADEPLRPGADPSVGIHHPAFGRYLRDAAAPLGVEVEVGAADGAGGDPGTVYPERLGDFFARRLRTSAGPAAP
jgi:acetyl esterase/lipase